jgi:hypothetical protein
MLTLCGRNFFGQNLPSGRQLDKFLPDTTTSKFLAIFLISELMFFGPKKEIPPWREVLFHRSARKGLTVANDLQYMGATFKPLQCVTPGILQFFSLAILRDSSNCKHCSKAS